MKSKILLGSVTLLSAFILSACGNGEKKTNETTAATTEVTTTADTSSEGKSVSYTGTKRIGRDDIGYVNVPKDWIITKRSSAKYVVFQSSSKHKLPAGTLSAYTENEVPLQDRLKFVATSFYNTLKSNENMTNNIDGEWTKVAGENAYVLKAQEKNGNYLYEWFFQKGATVYVFFLEGTDENISTFRPMLEQSWGLDSNTPGK